MWDEEYFAGRRVTYEEEEDEDAETKPTKKKKPIDFSRSVGVTVTDGDIRSVGFHCKECNFRCKDSATFLDHTLSPSRKFILFKNWIII